MQVVRMSIFSSSKLYLGSAPGSSYVDSLLGKFRRYDPLDEVEQQLKDINMLKQIGIQYVVLLQTRTELSYTEPSLVDLYESAGIKVIHYPIQDMHVPHSMQSLDKVLSLIYSLLKAGKAVYIHCMGGKGRTGLVAAALLIKSGKVSLRTAIGYVRQLRPGAIETVTQEKFLAEYLKKVTDAKATRRH